MAATVTGILLTGNHASRPSSGVSAGTLYSCTTHSLIYQTSDTGSTWATWANLAGTGLSDPMTTRGDVIVRNSSNTTARLAVGAANRVLKSDGTDPAWGQVTEAMQLLADNTTNNSSTSAHGYLKKLSNTATEYMDGSGNWSTPSGTGAVASDTLWDAKGDLAVGTGANTAAKLTVGANGAIPMAASGETTGLIWRRVIRGTVNADGTEASDPDGAFTSTKDSTGNYTVTYGSAFGATPLVLLTPWAFRLCRINTSSTTAFSVNSAAPNTGSDSDGKFSFLVIEV